MSEKKVGSVTYQEVGQDYFKRGLRRHAAFWSLWSLGVAAVISGDFYGWNLGLDAGGFGGLLIATIVTRSCTTGSATRSRRKSPPPTRVAYSFARARPWVRGAVSSLASPRTWSTSSRPAVVGSAMGFLMHDIMAGLFDISGEPWWNSVVTWMAIFYVIFVGISVIGIEITMRLTNA